jgi:hypothetical protein
LRRVIKQTHHLGGIGLRVPHRKGYCISREDLLRHVRPVELGLSDGAELPADLFLIVRPDPFRLAKETRQQALVKVWRILFHLYVDLAMRKKSADGSLTPARVLERIERLGLTEFAEVRDVLRQEDYLLPPESEETVYAEFAAVYLTMRRFDPDWVGRSCARRCDVGRGHRCRVDLPRQPAARSAGSAAGAGRNRGTRSDNDPDADAGA